MIKKTLIVLSRSLSLLCPQCGKSKLFSSWGAVYESCPHCSCDLQSREQDTWFFMYVSTAGITGIFVILLFLAAPKGSIASRFMIFLVAALTFISTLPHRKSLAIGLEFLFDRSGRVQE